MIKRFNVFVAIAAASLGFVVGPVVLAPTAAAQDVTAGYLASGHVILTGGRIAVVNAPFYSSEQLLALANRLWPGQVISATYYNGAVQVVPAPFIVGTPR